MSKQTLNPVIYDNQITIPFSLYGELIKGKQSFLLVFTSVFAYLISAYPTISFGNLFTLTISMFFAVSGSTLLNMYWDRDIDSKMERTKHRALPSGKIKASTVFWHGIIFTFGGIGASIFFNGLLTASIIAFGVFFDVVVYTIWLKRRTKWSIIFGGIAGGLPAVAGRVVATNSLDWISLLFMLFILLWIPLHILTLATFPKNLKGYSEAGIPMWPVVNGIDETLLVITIAAFFDGLILIFTGYILGFNLLAQIPLLLFGLIMIILSVKNFRTPSQVTTFRIFKMASMFMAMTFLWMYIAKVITF